MLSSFVRSFGTASLCAWFVLLPRCSGQTVKGPRRTVRADVSRTTGPHSPVPLRVVGAGRANEGIWQRIRMCLQISFPRMPMARSNRQSSLHLALSGMKRGRYQLQVYATGYLHQGAPDQLTRAQVAELNRASSGAPMDTKTLVVDDGSFTQDLPLRTNHVYLLTLTPVRESK